MLNPFARWKRAKQWGRLWDARTGVLESLYGPSDDLVGHASVPFDQGGQADILFFSEHIPGKLAVTCEMLGRADQLKNSLGTYELAIAHRSDDEFWGAEVAALLARYTTEAVLEPGETMDIADATPVGSTIRGLAFVDYGRSQFDGQPCGVLLCIGITDSELSACLVGRMDELMAALTSAEVYPYTDLSRDSVM